MNIFKFGGASVKDAKGVKNVVEVLKVTGDKEKVVVVSAMGKTTNALELVVKAYLESNQDLEEIIQQIHSFHKEILHGLFPNESHPIFSQIADYFKDLSRFLKHNKSPKYDFVYDQVVCYGELVSTCIISAYLNDVNMANSWLDVRKCIKTNSTHRDAKVDWTRTQEAIITNVDTNALTITQGFIGSDDNNDTTTLGREGSDYTAGIFAYCLNAESVTIWKDVQGVLNGDPREFDNTTLLEQISYEEAIELAFYGASVIHPKTLQPLQRKEIPLFVKSFLNPKDKGTAVSKGQRLVPYIPCFIVKKELVLISLSSLDFSFIVEENISEIFSLFHKYQMKVDLIQNSAISFSVCVDNKFRQLDKLINHLKAKFKVSYTEGVSLYTIRHFDDVSMKRIESQFNVLLKQVAKETVQVVVSG